MVPGFGLIPRLVLHACTHVQSLGIMPLIYLIETLLSDAWRSIASSSTACLSYKCLINSFYPSAYKNQTFNGDMNLNFNENKKKKRENLHVNLENILDDCGLKVSLINKESRGGNVIVNFQM